MVQPGATNSWGLQQEGPERGQEARADKLTAPTIPGKSTAAPESAERANHCPTWRNQ